MTIFALATPPGKSGVAVIRISGSKARDMYDVFGIATPPQPRITTLAALAYHHDTIDKALLVYFPAPHSFTGEDVVEIHCHGSRAVIRQILDILANIPGFRPAEAGEFTRRAFMNSKMDLTQVEGLADLIEADTASQRRQAMRIMQGEAGHFYAKLRLDILHGLSFLEAWIDFPDEDIPPSVTGQVDQEVRAILSAIESQLADSHISERIREGFYITILGSPNVGKSSLLNMLARRDVAIVSPFAGTTRDVIEVHLDMQGYSVLLADTAGIRDQADAIEQEGIRRSFETARRADIRIVVLDALELANGNWQMPDEIQTLVQGENTILLVNKCDLVTDICCLSICGIQPVLISVKERNGIEELLTAIEAQITALVPREPSFITRTRHRTHLQAASHHLQRYFQLSRDLTELSCEELRRAAIEIGKITGRIEVDEILGHIFSSFCIGK